MIVRRLIFVALSAAAAAAASGASAQQPTPASVRVTPQARALFERDWVLMNWALKFFDGDHDQLLSQAEAEAAASAFRRMADSDGDGRVTPQEYAAARESILTRG
jgi:hypothetical protein